MHIGSIATSAG